MRAVKKYYISINDYTLALPKNAQFLKVGFEHFSFVLWALVDPSEKLVNRRFHFVQGEAPLPSDTAKKVTYVGNFTHIGVVFNVFVEN